MAATTIVQLGENVTAAVEGDEIVLRIKKDYRGKFSDTGKSIRVASTEGNKPFNGITIGLNAYVKP